MSLAVVVVAKAPRPGLAKTRLEPLLGPEGCARLQRALIGRAGRWAAQVGPFSVAFTPADARAELAALLPAGTTLVAQPDGHLGVRLAHAFAHATAAHAGPVVLVGIDQPTLAAAHAAEVAEALTRADVVLGPALDGGYYLLAAHRDHPALFAIDPAAWGGPTVLARTRTALAAAGLTVAEIRPERDLDTPEDARALLADPAAPTEVRAALDPHQIVAKSSSQTSA